MVTLRAEQTAVIVVDMWDKFTCATFQTWADDLAIRMNDALAYFRDRRVPILFMGEDVLPPYKKTVGAKLLRTYLPACENWTQIEHPMAPGRDSWWNGVCVCNTDEVCRGTDEWSTLHPHLIRNHWDLIGA